MSNSPVVKKILVLAANPVDMDRLRLNQEVQEIEEKIQRSRLRDQFQVIVKWAVRTGDLQRIFLDEKPQIVHFCGHGRGEEGLVLENVSGKSQVVPTQALSDLFGLLQESIECVLLNACYSKVQAEAIHQHISCVIGMTDAILDRTALKFSASFYRAIGAGESYKKAYEFGCNEIDLENIPGGQAPIIHIKAKPLKSQIFISYKRDETFDESIVSEIQRELGDTHEVIIDRLMEIGTRWAEWIDQEIRQSDFLIVLLSEASAHSEMVLEEIEKARYWEERQGHPKILPIRLNYKGALGYPLSAYLNHINWFLWRGETDTPQLIEELQRAIVKGTLAVSMIESLEVGEEPRVTATIQPPQPAAQPLEKPDQGTMKPDSPFYVIRDADQAALSAIEEEGVTITIRGSRQMGKSSLLNRTMAAARARDKQIAYFDFQLFDQTTLSSSDHFFRAFCTLMTDELGLEDRIEDYWQRPIGNSQCCTRYVVDHVLKQLSQPLVLAMDEVEKVFCGNFQSSDFFGMLRSWHNNRATNSLWQRLDLVLVISTEPYQLIENLNQSPFNVGERVDLQDFTAEQVVDLNQRHGSPFNSAQLQRLMNLLSGHPYLVRKALYLVASGQSTVESFFNKAVAEDGAFADHLKYYLSRLSKQEELRRGMVQIIQNRTCPNEEVFSRLQGIGLVKRMDHLVVPRCQLYTQYFQERLRG
jgi:AAA-like domain/TIR domain